METVGKNIPLRGRIGEDGSEVEGGCIESYLSSDPESRGGGEGEGLLSGNALAMAVEKYGIDHAIVNEPSIGGEGAATGGAQVGPFSRGFILCLGQPIDKKHLSSRSDGVGRAQCARLAEAGRRRKRFSKFFKTNAVSVDGVSVRSL